MGKHKISVIIPTINRRDLLAETMKSVMAQTSPDWEAIIVDDGSTDDSAEYAMALAGNDSRIKFLTRQRMPKGAGTCRNIGLVHSEHDYVIFLDSDDLMEPECIENRLKAIASHPEYDFLVFQIASFTTSASEPEFLWNIDNQEDDLYRFIKLDAVWQTSGAVWKKESVNLISGFDENLQCWQDVDIHLRALVAGLSYRKFLDEKPDILYRRQNQFSISQQQIHSAGKLKSRKEILRKAYIMAEKRSVIKRELRWMASSIIISAANGHRFNYASDILFTSWKRGILNIREVADLLRLLMVVKLRLERLSAGKKIKQRISDRTIWKSSICTIPVAKYC